MEISQTPPAVVSTSAANTTDETSDGGITSDFDTFLRMLTVQLQNQDPLNPIESSDYAVQLATFSGVEQQVQTNDLLAQLVNQSGAAGLTQLAGWVGQEARVPGYGSFSGQPVTIVPDAARGQDSAQLLIRNSDGSEVYRATIPTTGDPITWDGTTTSGAPLPNGTYKFDIVQFEGGSAISEAPAEIYSRVTEVRLQDGSTAVVLASGKIIPTSDVTALREAQG